MTDTAQTDTNRDLVLTRLIDASPEAVYRCWTDPALLLKWFAPKPWTTPRATLDVRPGGASMVVMADENGNDVRRQIIWRSLGLGLPRKRGPYSTPNHTQKYREAAKKQLLRDYPQEIGEPASARAKEVREAWRQNQSGGMSSATGGKVQELLAGYGIK
jgi:hypothetical protein